VTKGLEIALNSLGLGAKA